MYLRRFRLSLEETKSYFDCVNCSCRNKMSYELARWTHDDVRVISSRDFLQFPIFGPAVCCQHFLCFILCNRSIQMTVVHVSKACGPSCLDKVMKMKDHSTKYESVFKLRSNVKGVETNAPKNVYKSRHIETRVSKRQ